MQLRALSFLFFLTFAHTFNAMETTTELVNTQQASGLCKIPLELIPKFLFPNSSWMLVRTALRLKAACTYFNTLLSSAAKKAIIATLFFDNSDFNENECAFSAFANLVRNEKEMSLLLIKVSSPELYLFAGADVNYVSQGNTFLIRVAQKVNADDYSMYLDTLIKMGANVNYKGGGDNTALHLAVSQNAIRCVELLLLAKADATIQNSSGKKPHEWFDNEHCHIKDNPEHCNRIQQLLNGSITVEESRKQPLPELKQHIAPSQGSYQGSYNDPVLKVSIISTEEAIRRLTGHSVNMTELEKLDESD